MTGSLNLWLIPLVPFAGFLVNGLVGRKLPKVFVSAIALIATLIPFLQVAKIWFQFPSITTPYIEKLGTWIWTGAFHADFTLQLDQLTMIMLLIVTGVGFLIHIYSVGYMAHEEGYWRFFAYLNLFMFFMLTLVLSENFLLMFVGWEGVGLASYLLIGFYFLKDSAARAGIKAFVVNRIGDFGFLLAMFLIVAHFGTLSFGEVFAKIPADPTWQPGFITAIALCLVLGATGKSAQIPLYVWLPDAMEGPTPVSALIHAATMVTAGVYMMARSHAIFDHSPIALSTVAFIGAITCFFAATMGLVQTDIKRVLAYSTVSQLGYMFLACGVASYSAGIFHLVTHAFFKALLFLSAGAVIHSLGGEQDMRVMGGLRKKDPHYILDNDHGGLRDLWISALRRFLQQGRDSLPGVHLAAWRQTPLVHRMGHCGPYLVSICSGCGISLSLVRAALQPTNSRSKGQPFTPDQTRNSCLRLSRRMLTAFMRVPG